MHILFVRKYKFQINITQRDFSHSYTGLGQKFLLLKDL